METELVWVGHSLSNVSSELFISQHHQPQPHRMHDRLAAALDSQFAEEGIDVEFDGVVADAEALGDSLVGEALGEELEDFALAGCQGLGQIFGRSGGVAQ